MGRLTPITHAQQEKCKLRPTSEFSFTNNIHRPQSSILTLKSSIPKAIQIQYTNLSTQQPSLPKPSPLTQPCANGSSTPANAPSPAATVRGSSSSYPRNPTKSTANGSPPSKHAPTEQRQASTATTLCLRTRTSRVTCMLARKGLIRSLLRSRRGWMGMGGL
jgi:hypothetical protein